MTTETAAKKDTQRLQRAIVDGLEDVKGQDIQVFNTEHLSPLFERVIIASGTSNRQTKALASSVRDAVKEAGFPKPRIEGEDNGEWIIVDCGAAVAHIMQPTIRQYYHLEEIWGDKPVRLKFGAPQPARAEAEAPAPRRKAAAKKAVEPTLRRSSAAKTAVKAAEAVARAEKAERAAPKRKPAAKTGARTPAKAPAAKTGSPASVKTMVVKAPVRAASRKPAPGTPAKKAVARKAPARKA
jgi:ribosome-associated protein